MDKLTIRAFMTAAPRTIGARQPLAQASLLMREHHIRHLPVLDGGRLVGVVSERDIAHASARPGFHGERLMVAEAMTVTPHIVSPETSLEWAAAEMAQHKFGCLVVVDHQRVVGIFTTVDAVRALQELLGRARRRRRPIKASSLLD
jgi:acetoin utilization protein AcuB